MQYPSQHTDLEIDTDSNLIDFDPLDEEFDSIGLEASWQELHKHSFVESGLSYKRLRAAYRTGYEGAQKYASNLKPVGEIWNGPHPEDGMELEVRDEMPPGFTEAENAARPSPEGPSTPGKCIPAG